MNDVTGTAGHFGDWWGLRKQPKRGSALADRWGRNTRAKNIEGAKAPRWTER